MTRTGKFDIALSFSGEDRPYVDQVATQLRQKGISVFYDLFEEQNLWGKNLYEYLSDIYMNQARYTIMFISESYSKRLWPNHERQSLQARAFQENEEYVLPARFDETEIPGILPTIGYIDLKLRDPSQFVNLIEKKLITSGATIPSENLRKSFSLSIKTLRIDPIKNSITVKDDNGDFVEEAQVVLSADNGTYLQGTTDKLGNCTFNIPTRRNYSVLIAHPYYPSYIHNNFDPNSDLEIILQKRDNVSSIIIQSTGYITGFNGRLNPILDSSNRTYLYADNIAIDGGKGQPVAFTINETMSLEDNHGNIIILLFRYITGRTTALIDYTRPRI
ncbi:MAG: TIR domain-containing protein [Bacteroidales bacterium]|nr:TIR domain-containing protein [Bacteroidales bacterium]